MSQRIINFVYVMSSKVISNTLAWKNGVRPCVTSMFVAFVACIATSAALELALRMSDAACTCTAPQLMTVAHLTGLPLPTLGTFTLHMYDSCALYYYVSVNYYKSFT